MSEPIRYRDSDQLLKSALEGLGVPVQRLFYEGTASEFIVYYHAGSVLEGFANDAMHYERHTYQVNIYARAGHLQLLRRVRAALYAAKFEGITALTEEYMPETKLYCIPMQCEYTEYVTEVD